MTNSIKTNDKAEDELIVIADECGDTMWDAVLQQEVGVCKINGGSNNANALLNKLTEVKVCLALGQTTEAK